MKIVYSYYVLDLIHEGHLLMMKNAKKIAGENGKSIVGILTDEATMEKKSKPAIPFPERIQLASAIKYVDVAVAQDTYSPLTNVEHIRPDILLEYLRLKYNEPEEKVLYTYLFEAKICTKCYENYLKEVPLR